MSARPVAVRDPLTEASAWRIALCEHDAETSAEFERWLASDPDNREAWHQVQSSWDLLGDLSLSDELSAMRRQALVRAAGERKARRQPWWGAIAACLLLIVASMGIYQYRDWQAAQPELYATALAERRVITLDDQSRITLDSNSKVEVLYSNDARKLVLLQGQARFDVAKDPLRPFSVRALDRLIVAIGTAFTVDLLNKNVTVTLIEGKVAVLKAPAAKGDTPPANRARDKSEVSLVAGQQLVAEAGQAILQVQPANIEKTSSWEQGLLMFEDETLSAVAARVSRYSDRPILVDESVADLRISGVFVAGDVDTFVDAVSRYLPVSARSGPKGVELTRRG